MLFFLLVLIALWMTIKLRHMLPTFGMLGFALILFIPLRFPEWFFPIALVALPIAWAVQDLKLARR